MQKVRIKFAYKAGFRRLWLVASVLWAIFVIQLLFNDPHISSWQMLGSVVAPIAGAYLAGVAVVWVIEGFATTEG